MCGSRFFGPEKKIRGNLVGHDGTQPGSWTWEAETGGQEGLSLQIMSH